MYICPNTLLMVYVALASVFYLHAARIGVRQMTPTPTPYPIAVITANIAELETGLSERGHLTISGLPPREVREILQGLPRETVVALSDMSLMPDSAIVSFLETHINVILLYSRDNISKDILDSVASVKSERFKWKPIDVLEALEDRDRPITPSDSPKLYEFLYKLNKSQLPRKRDLVFLATKESLRD